MARALGLGWCPHTGAQGRSMCGWSQGSEKRGTWARATCQVMAKAGSPRTAVFQEWENSESKLFIKKINFSLCLLCTGERLFCHKPASAENGCLGQAGPHRLLGQEVTSPLLSASLSAAVLKPPETPTDDSLAAWPSQRPWLSCACWWTFSSSLP